MRAEIFQHCSDAGEMAITPSSLCCDSMTIDVEKFRFDLNEFVSRLFNKVVKIEKLLCNGTVAVAFLRY